jgi:hypothetical protein
MASPWPISTQWTPTHRIPTMTTTHSTSTSRSASPQHSAALAQAAQVQAASEQAAQTQAAQTPKANPHKRSAAQAQLASPAPRLPGHSLVPRSQMSIQERASSARLARQRRSSDDEIQPDPRFLPAPQTALHPASEHLSNRVSHHTLAPAATGTDTLNSVLDGVQDYPPNDGIDALFGTHTATDDWGLDDLTHLFPNPNAAPGQTNADVHSTNLHSAGAQPQEMDLLDLVGHDTLPPDGLALLEGDALHRGQLAPPEEADLDLGELLDTHSEFDPLSTPLEGHRFSAKAIERAFDSRYILGEHKELMDQLNKPVAQGGVQLQGTQRSRISRFLLHLEAQIPPQNFAQLRGEDISNNCPEALEKAVNDGIKSVELDAGTRAALNATFGLRLRTLGRTTVHGQEPALPEHKALMASLKANTDLNRQQRHLITKLVRYLEAQSPPQSFAQLRGEKSNNECPQALQKVVNDGIKDGGLPTGTCAALNTAFGLKLRGFGRATANGQAPEQPEHKDLMASLQGNTNLSQKQRSSISRFLLHLEAQIPPQNFAQLRGEDISNNCPEALEKAVNDGIKSVELDAGTRAALNATFGLRLRTLGRTTVHGQEPALPEHKALMASLKANTDLNRQQRHLITKLVRYLEAQSPPQSFAQLRGEKSNNECPQALQKVVNDGIKDGGLPTGTCAALNTAFGLKLRGFGRATANGQAPEQPEHKDLMASLQGNTNLSQKQRSSISIFLLHLEQQSPAQSFHDLRGVDLGNDRPLALEQMVNNAIKHERRYERARGALNLAFNLNLKGPSGRNKW